MLLTKQRVYWLIIRKQIEKKNSSFKKGFFKFLLDKIKSIVAFKMSELGMISKDGFPYSNVWVKEEWVISNNLQSMFLIVRRREDQSLLYIGQWIKKCAVDSPSAPHLHNGFSESWKLCLNLCSQRWQRPRRSLVRNLIPCGLWHSNTLSGEGLIKFRMTFLKVP